MRWLGRRDWRYRMVIDPHDMPLDGRRKIPCKTEGCDGSAEIDLYSGYNSSGLCSKCFSESWVNDAKRRLRKAEQELNIASMRKEVYDAMVCCASVDWHKKNSRAWDSAAVYERERDEARAERDNAREMEELHGEHWDQECDKNARLRVLLRMLLDGRCPDCGGGHLTNPNLGGPREWHCACGFAITIDDLAALAAEPDGGERKDR